MRKSTRFLRKVEIFVASRVATSEVHERAIKIYTGKILTTSESPIFQSHVNDYPRRIGLSSVRSIDAKTRR